MAQGYKTGGRSKGTPNKTTKQVREQFAKLLQENIEGLQKDLDELDPKERVKALLAIAKFVVPTLRSVEVESLPEDSFQPFVITINKTE